MRSYLSSSSYCSITATGSNNRATNRSTNKKKWWLTRNGNATKYAFTGSPHGNIYVSLKQDDDCILTIADDGIGFDTSTTGTNSPGLTLIHGLAAQVDGQLDIRSDSDGVTITIRFSYHDLS